MTKPLGRYLLAVLHYLRIEAPEEMKKFHGGEIHEWMEKWTASSITPPTSPGAILNPTPPASQLDRKAHSFLFDRESGHYPAQMGIDAAIEKLQNYIGNKRDDTSDLIDELAEILKGTMVRNRLSGDTLRLLREVILRGDEADEARKALKQNILKCAGDGCGKEFTTSYGEAVTLSRNGDGDYVIYCAKCSIAKVWSCSHEGCQNPVPVSSDMQSAWHIFSKGANCGSRHTKKKKDEELEEEVGRSPSRPALDATPGAAIISPSPTSRQNPRYRTSGPRAARRVQSSLDDAFHRTVQEWAGRMATPAASPASPPLRSPYALELDEE